MRLIIILWKKIGGIATFGTLFLLVGAFLIAMDFADMSAFVKYRQPVDVYDVDDDELEKNLWVKSDMNLVLDCFGEIEHTTKKNGSITSRYSDYYYMIPVNGEEGRMFMIAVEVKQKDMNQYDKIVESTWKYLNGETNSLDEYDEVEGLVKDLDSEMYDYMIELLVDEYEFTEDEAREFSAPYVIEHTSVMSGVKMFMIGLGIFLGGVCLIVLGCFLRFRKVKVGNAPVQMVTLHGMQDNVVYSQVATAIDQLASEGPGAFINLTFQKSLKGMTALRITHDMMDGTYFMTLSKMEKGQLMNYYQKFDLQNLYGVVGKIFMQKEIPNVKKWNSQADYNNQMVG